MVMADNIAIERVSYTYKPVKGPPVQALKDITLEVRGNEFLALLGPSGCGKSTLLFMIGGFLPTESGQIRISGTPVTQPSPQRGIVFQHFALFPWRTVLGNVAYGLEKAGVPRGERLSRARHYIEMVKLSGFENSYPSQLSGGMRQRAAIARTLAVEPNTLLMDEPFGALDAQTRTLMHEELSAIIQNSPKTIVFVTHDVQEAVKLADRVAVMSRRPGRIKEIVELPRDRDASFVRSPEFIETVEHLWGLIRDEAARAQAEH
jgi:NitT/TauT family transport system ATP-binding protein